MTGVSQDWIFVAVFFGAFLVVTAGEIYWLTSKLQVPVKKALTTVLLSNFGTITLGFFVTFVIFGLLLAFTSGENAGVGATGTWLAFIVAPAFLFFRKPVRVDTGESFDERRFTVVYVPSGADDDVHQSL